MRLRVSKESIFTGLNNLIIYGITNLPCSQHFGFTASEVQDFVSYYRLDDTFSIIKDWYDGYLFGDTEIYNPWSVINFISDAIADSRFLPRPYWSNTSSNDIIRQLVVSEGTKIHESIEVLMKGEVLSRTIYEYITYRNIDVNSNYIWSFLLFTGYLKAERLY